VYSNIIKEYELLPKRELYIVGENVYHLCNEQKEQRFNPGFTVWTSECLGSIKLVIKEKQRLKCKYCKKSYKRFRDFIEVLDKMKP